MEVLCQTTGDMFDETQVEDGGDVVRHVLVVLDAHYPSVLMKTITQQQVKSRWQNVLVIQVL